MKKNRKCCYITNILIITLVFMFMLTGCQLAKETGTAVTTNKDQLCGVFVTFGHQELPVNQESLQDVSYDVGKNGEIVFDNADFNSLFQNKVEGIPNDDGSSIKFTGVEGFYMGAVHQIINGEDSTTYMGDKGFYDSKYNVNVTDNGQLNSSESSLAVSTKFKDVVNVNPVYIRGDGTYYTIIGQSMGMSFSGSTAGSVYSQTLDNAFTTTVDGKTTTEKESFKVNIAVKDETKQLFIKEMNQSDELIRTTQYHQEDPEDFIVDNNTAYVIVEELLENAAADTYVKRSIYSLDKDDSENNKVTHICSYADKDFVIGVKSINLCYDSASTTFNK